MELFGLSKEGRKALFYYQEEAVQSIIDLYNQKKNTLAILATGTGKTIIGAEVLRRMGKNSLWLAHRDNLLDAAIARIHAQTGIMPHKEKASVYASTKAQIVCASIQSMKNARLQRFSAFHFDYGMIDEAHHAMAKTYRNVLDYFDFNHTGLTATPDRKDNKQLSEVYDEVAYEYPLHKAIKEGFLAPIKGFKVQDFEIDLSALRLVAGDYQDKDLEVVITEYLNPISASVKEQTEGLKTLLFLPTVESARVMTEVLNASGIDADYVAGNKDNASAFYNFHVGNITHLCSVDMVLEGYDEPSIEAIVMLRPTSSRTIYSQIVGRGTRLYPGKDFLRLVEFTYNSDNLKLVSPFELFSTAGYGEGVQEAAEGDIAGASEIDYLGTLEAAADRFYSVEGIVSRLFKPVKGYSFATFDPVAFGDLLGVDITGEFDIHYQGRKLTGSATMKQLDILQRFGIAGNGEVDKAQASMLIGKIFEKDMIPFKGPATQKQIQILKKYGIKTEGVMKAQATVLIQQIMDKMNAEPVF